MMFLKLSIKRCFFFLCTSALLFFSGCNSKNEPISHTGIYFDTIISISIYDSLDKNLLTQCFELAKHYDALFSKTIEGSDVWNINHSEGVPVSVQEETIILLNKSIYYATFSEGVVDPTVGVLSSLWDFGEDSYQIIPDDSLLSKSCSFVNYKNLVIDDKNNTVTLLNASMQIDLGFIAKGYIADQIKKYLESEGVSSALINLGGNILMLGTKPNGAFFTIGIQEPFETTGSATIALNLSDCSVVSSGIYERFFVKDGIVYHHILDTQTGYPIQNELASVTIISDNSVDGDALSTLCFALGLEDGTKLIENLDHVSAIFITQDGKQYPVKISLPTD